MNKPVCSIAFPPQFYGRPFGMLTDCLPHVFILNDPFPNEREHTICCFAGGASSRLIQLSLFSSRTVRSRPH